MCIYIYLTRMHSISFFVRVLNIDSNNKQNKNQKEWKNFFVAFEHTHFIHISSIVTLMLSMIDIYSYIFFLSFSFEIYIESVSHKNQNSSNKIDKKKLHVFSSTYFMESIY